PDRPVPKPSAIDRPVAGLVQNAGQQKDGCASSHDRHYWKRFWDRHRLLKSYRRTSQKPGAIYRATEYRINHYCPISAHARPTPPPDHSNSDWHFPNPSGLKRKLYAWLPLRIKEINRTFA